MKCNPRVPNGKAGKAKGNTICNLPLRRIKLAIVELNRHANLGAKVRVVVILILRSRPPFTGVLRGLGRKVPHGVLLECFWTPGSE